MKQKYWIIKYIVDNEETKIASKKKKEEQIQIIDEKLKKKDKVTSYACIFIFSSAVWLLIKSDYISG